MIIQFCIERHVQFDSIINVLKPLSQSHFETAREHDYKHYFKYPARDCKVKRTSHKVPLTAWHIV